MLLAIRHMEAVKGIQCMAQGARDGSHRNDMTLTDGDGLVHFDGHGDGDKHHRESIVAHIHQTLVSLLYFNLLHRPLPLTREADN